LTRVAAIILPAQLAQLLLMLGQAPLQVTRVPPHQPRWLEDHAVPVADAEQGLRHAERHAERAALPAAVGV